MAAVKSESSKRQKKPNSYRSWTKQISKGTQLSQVPSISQIIEIDDQDIIQYAEKEASNAILTNIFGKESSDSGNE